MAGCQVTPSSSSEVVAESGWNVRCPDKKFCHLAGPGRHHPVTVTEGHQHLQRGQYYSLLQLCSTQAASIFPECWGNIRILKLWFENYFSKGKFIGEVFLSHSASTLLLAVIAWMVFGNRILFAGAGAVIFIFKVENSWTLAPHHSNDLGQPDLVGSNVCTKQET